MPEMPVEAGFGTELLSHQGPKKVNFIIIRTKLKSRHRIEIHPLGNVCSQKCPCQSLKRCHEKQQWCLTDTESFFLHCAYCICVIKMGTELSVEMAWLEGICMRDVRMHRREP